MGVSFEVPSSKLKMTKKVDIGNIAIGDYPKIVAVIGGDNVLDAANIAKSDGADIIEIRIDLFKEITPELYDLDYVIQKVKEVKETTKCPLIITVRRTLENGLYYVFSGSEQKRLEIFKTLMPFVDGVDIETNSSIKKEVIRCARQQGVAVIESYHNFSMTEKYADLVRIVKDMRGDKPDIIKIATMPLGCEDFVTLNKIFIDSLERGEKITIVPQGEENSLFRVTFPKMGSCLAYGHVGKKNAPGQLSVNEMVYALETNETMIPIPVKSLEYLQLKQ
jgi:3-dehydroquinate dehydratase-1